MSRNVAMLVSNACAPDRRVLREAQALARHGYEVSVIAWDREGRYPARETMSEVAIERIGVPSGYGLGIKRLGHWPAFVHQALKYLRLQVWDTIHCHDLDTLPLGYLYTRLYAPKTCLLFDAHESYPDLVAPRLPAWAVEGGLRRLERFLVGRVNAVITVGDLLADHYRRSARQVAIVRNCPAPVPMISDPLWQLAMRREWGLDGVDLVLCYIGGFTRGRVILPLIEAVKLDPAAGLVLVGEGPQAPELLKASAGNDRIAYLGPRVPPEQVVSIMGATDAVYYGLRSDYPNNRFSAPNALYSALEAGRPLVTTDVGEISQVVRDKDCGIILSAPSVGAIMMAFEQLRDLAVRGRLSRNARHAAETQYNWPAAEAELVHLYRTLQGDA